MNPFSNAKIICHDADPLKYNAEPEQRGSPKFTMRPHVLAEILRNARRWVDGYESPESKAKAYGDMLDCIALTPLKWPQRFCTLPSDAPRRPSDRQRNAKDPSEATILSIKWWDKFNAENEGKTIIDADDLGSVQAAVRALRSHVQIAELLQISACQVWISATYTDKQTGISVPVKSCLDILPDPKHPIFGDSIADLKTARNVGPRQFARAVFDYNYDLQAALELDIFEAATGEKRSQFYHIAQENYAPYHCRLPALAEAFIGRGRMRYQFALAKYCRCLDSGSWPGYDEVEWPITTPEPWMLDQVQLYGDLEEADEEPAPAEPTEVIP